MYGSQYNLYSTNYYTYTNTNRYHYAKDKGPASVTAKRKKELWEEHVANARQVPSFYSDQEDDPLYLSRYKLRKVHVAEVGPLSESPFMVNTERFDMAGVQDPDAYRKETTGRILACGPKPSDILDCIQTLHMAQTLGIPPEQVCYNHLAGLLLQLGRYDQFLSWYDELRRDHQGTSRSLPMLHALLCACCYSDHSIRAIATAKALLGVSQNTGRPVLFPTPDTVTSNYLPEDSGRSSAQKTLVAVFQALPQMVLRILMESSALKVAHQVVEYLLQHDMELPMDTVLLLFKELMQAEDDCRDTAFALFTTLCKIEQFSFPLELLHSFVLVMAEAEDDGEKVFEVAHYMQEKQLQWNSTTATAILRVCDKNANAAVAMELFPTFLEQDVIDMAAFATYIILLTRTHAVPLSKTMDLYRDRQQNFGLSSDDTDLYRCIYCACFEQSNIMQAVELLEDVSQSGCAVMDALLALYDFCCTSEAADHMQELTLTPSADGEENQTELDRLLSRALFVDVVAFETFIKLCGPDKPSHLQACRNIWHNDAREFFGQRGEEFSTIFSEATVGRMCKGRSFLLLFDSSAIAQLADQKVRSDLELLMSEGQARSQKKSVILVAYQTQVQLMKRAHEEEAKTALQVLGEWYRGRGDWLKFLHFSNFLECVLRFSSSVAGTAGDATSERLGLLAWLETFSTYHKSVLLVTEDEQTKAEAAARRIIGISINTLLQALNA